MSSGTLAKKLCWGFVLALAILHQDFWLWSDRSLVFGFIPVGLFYHALLSVLAAVAWALVVRHAWPAWLEDWAGARDTNGAERNGR